jgi:two-component system response regulator ChvI
VTQAGDLVLDADRYAAAWRGRPIRLTVTEFLLLEALARRPGHVKSRDQLLTAAYPHDTTASDRTIDSHVKRLRRKFQDADPAFDALESVYGAGYRLRTGDR